MVEIGDKVVHLRYGAGTVTGQRVMRRQGIRRPHYEITLADATGTLLIPEDAIEDAELRPALRDTNLIENVMEAPPDALHDNHRTRQGTIEKKLNSGQPVDIAQVLRDLTWRELTGKLTGTDRRLRKSALERLVGEIALGASQTSEAIQTRLDCIVDAAMQRHLANQPGLDGCAVNT